MAFAEALERVVRGRAALGLHLRDLPDGRVPIDAQVLIQAYADDVAGLRERVERYRILRNEIDEIVDASL